MDKQSVTTSIAPEVIIEQVLGNLQVRGWERPEVVVGADPDDLDLQEQDDVVRLSCQSDCNIRLPRSANIQINGVHGNAQFKILEDQLTIEQVHGSLAVRSVASLQVDTVHGELSARDLSGDLQIGLTIGNASVWDVHGRCFLEEVRGNLDVRNAEGEVHATARGNARIRLGVMLGMNYQIHADGNVQCRIPEDADLEIDLSSEAQLIKVRLPDEKKTFRETHSDLILGNGDARMSISAGGTLHLSAQEADWRDAGDRESDYSMELPDDFSQQITEQVQAQIQSQMEAMTRQMNEQMESLTEKVSQSGLSPEQIERIMEQARKVNEREAARAQEKIRRAQEKLERKLEAARRRNEARAARHRGKAQDRRSWGIEWPSSPPPPVEQAVSEEERLMILRMLEQRKISLEEADQLLAALEGKG